MDIETRAQLETALRQRVSLSHARLQGLDLRGLDEAFARHGDVAGMVVLGGAASPALLGWLLEHHAVVFPSASGSTPVDPYRGSLYTADDLYLGLDDGGYATTPDACAYQWSLRSRHNHDVFPATLQAIHDTAISDALDELIDGHPVVGVMGGHSLPRGTAGYADAARLGHRLAATGAIVVTGGGPGAMEAANLGAAAPDTTTLSAALEVLAGVPSFEPGIDDWARTGFAARALLHDGVAPERPVRRPPLLRSLGIPTWFYGHEPPNVFSEAIAKYFSNAIREEGLLARCTAGLVVLPGQAGTVQEVFAALTPRYYTLETDLPPLILVGHEHWTRAVPLWDGITALARDRPLARAVHLVPDVDAAADLMASR